MPRIPAFVLLICLIVSACTHSMTATALTATPTSLPTIAFTQTPTATSTKAIATLTQASTQTPIRSSTAFPTDTQISVNPTSIGNTSAPSGLALLKDAIRHGSSPDGNWLWGVDGSGYKEPGTDLVSFKTFFVSKDEKTFWSVWPQTKDIGNVYEAEAYYLPLFWLKNEPYVYLVGSSCCRDGIYGYTGMNLARLDLKTGRFSIPISGWMPHTFAFSETGKFLLDTRYNVPYLRFIRLMDWIVFDIPVNPKYVFNQIAVYSPDQDKAVIESCQERDGDSMGGCYQYSLLLVDITQGDYRVLVPDMLKAVEIDFDEFFNQVYQFKYRWYGSNQILITVQSYDKDVMQFIFDINKNRLSKKQ